MNVNSGRGKLKFIHAKFMSKSKDNKEKPLIKGASFTSFFYSYLCSSTMFHRG